MRVAIPCEGHQVCEQVSLAPQFMFVDADLATGRIRHEELLAAPPVQPALLARWVAAHGADVVLTMGTDELGLEGFFEEGLNVVTGVMLRDPHQAVADYLGGLLSTGTDTGGRGGPSARRGN